MNSSIHFPPIILHFLLTNNKICDIIHLELHIDVTFIISTSP
nr:MAG TPA: hypothetical protein [Caudoviricetes sp.]